MHSHRPIRLRMRLPRIRCNKRTQRTSQPPPSHHHHPNPHPETLHTQKHPTPSPYRHVLAHPIHTEPTRRNDHIQLPLLLAPIGLFNDNSLGGEPEDGLIDVMGSGELNGVVVDVRAGWLQEREGSKYDKWW